MSDIMVRELSSPTTYDGDDFQEKLEQAMDCFYNSFLKKDVKPTYNNRSIFFSMDKYFGNVKLPFPERFLHIVSLDDEDKFDVNPCINDIAREICENQCENESQWHYFKFIKRWECPYRLHRIHWIIEVIRLANSSNSHVDEWSVLEKSTSGNYKKRLIRYHYKLDDYLIIFKERRSDYLR